MVSTLSKGTHMGCQEKWKMAHKQTKTTLKRIVTVKYKIIGK